MTDPIPQPHRETAAHAPLPPDDDDELITSPFDKQPRDKQPREHDAPPLRAARASEPTPIKAQPVTAEALAGLSEMAQKSIIEPVKLHPLLEKMAVEALRLHASDIFINTEYPPAFKINGVVTPAPVKMLTMTEVTQVVFSTMNAPQQKRFLDELELNYAVRAKNGVRFRVNTYHEQGRIGMVMRRITTDIPTIDELFLPQTLKNLAMRPRGLIILAGPTGCGKSTSQAAMLDWRNEHSACHIVTIEDPIEFVHKPKKSIITHREVGIDTLSWSNAVQSALREAPDVVCIGEVRNSASMEYAMQLAQTGHLCFFTIHANNAAQAIERMLNYYSKEFHQQVLLDLALNLVCVIGQRLVIKKGGKGRRAIIDLLINTPAMQDYLFKGELVEIKSLMAKAEVDGMQTFDQDLFNLYRDGIIDYNEALRQADSANDLRLQIQLYEDGRQGETIYDKTENLNLI